MMKPAKMIPLLLVTFLAAPVFAQSTATDVQRDVNQQQRIENGLKSGQLNTREAAKLEHEEAKVDRAEANALKDGSRSSRGTNMPPSPSALSTKAIGRSVGTNAKPT